MHIIVDASFETIRSQCIVIDEPSATMRQIRDQFALIIVNRLLNRS